MNEALIRELIYTLAMAAQTNAEIAGMTAENMHRERRGESMAFTQQDFINIAVSNGMTHNQTLQRIQNVS